MEAAPRPENESARLKAVFELGVLDRGPDPELEDMALLASEVCSTPVAMISFLDAGREWIQASIGAPFREFSRESSFCAYPIAQESALEICDTRLDGRFTDHPFVLGEAQLLFYAGVPLITRAKFFVGAVCVMDTTPRKLTRLQWRCMRVLAKAITCHLECRGGPGASFAASRAQGAQAP